MPGAVRVGGSVCDNVDDGGGDQSDIVQLQDREEESSPSDTTPFVVEATIAPNVNLLVKDAVKTLNATVADNKHYLMLN